MNETTARNIIDFATTRYRKCVGCDYVATASSGRQNPPEESWAKGESTVQAGRYRYTDEKGEHLHSLDGKPLVGTSTAVQCLGKNGLQWWAAERAAIVCLKAGECIPTIEEELAAVKQFSGYARKKAMDALQKKYPILKKARYAHRCAKEEAAGPGSAMHRALENYLNYCIQDYDGEPVQQDKYEHDAAERFAIWAEANVQEFLWSEAHCYSEQLWTGGICDLGMIMKGGDYAIGDFKSSREAYDSHFVQAGGYARQIKENGLLRADGSVVSLGMRHVTPKRLIVFPFGASSFEPDEVFNVAEFMSAFEATVVIHKLIRKFESR